MRKVLFFVLLLVSTVSFSQAPQYLNYQAIARNAAGTIVTTPIGIKFEILQGSASGALVYEETNNITPSSAGVFTAAIGNGSIVMGNFPTINWANSPYFIRVSIDPAGGTSYSTVGTSQLLSVPYALYAEKAGNTQTVSITGPSVIGTYPNYTITPGAPLTASTGISIAGGTITNTAPDQTVTISGPGVTGAYPNYTITPIGALTPSTGISISSGTITNTAPDQTVTISGAIGAYPNFTVTPTPSTTLTAGNSNISISGTSPNYTVSSIPTLSLSGAQLSISNGNTVTLPTGTTYTNGAGISLTSGTIITNTAPNQTVTIANGTNVVINGTYPNYTVNATPTLSLATNVLSISGGNSVTLPTPLTYSAGNGISIVSGTIINTSPNQSVSVSGAGVSGSYPNYTVTSAAATTVTAGNNINVIGSVPNYTIGSPTYSLNFPNSSVVNVTNGINTSTASIPQPTLTLGGAFNNVISAGSNSITIANFAAGNGLTMGGAFPLFTLSTSSTGTNAAWNTLGNSGTNATSNFIGTTDNIPFNIRVNNQKAGRIDHLLANAFYGYQAGNANSTGTFNVAFGNQALLSNTNGSYNTALGTNALYFNSTGNYNTSVGYQALYSNTIGNYNTANGQQALYGNTTGSQNTAAGFFALHDNTSGLSNAAFGWYALNKNTTGGQNTASGEQALYWVNGNYNSGHGYGSLQNNTSGNQNTASGALAGYNNTGSGNVFLGYQAGYNELGSNKLYIANSSTNPPLIYGDFSSGNVGIGTTAPTALLEINSPSFNVLTLKTSGGNSNINVDAYPTGAGTLQFRTPTANGISFSTSNISRMIIDPAGNVGIGTGGPSYPLHVFKSAANIFAASIENTDPTGWGLEVRTAGNTAAQNAFEVYSSGISRFLVRNDGNVGIGTSNPNGPLHIKSNSSGSFIINENTNSGNNPFGLEFMSPAQTWYFMQGPGTGPANSLVIYDGTAGAYRMVILPSSGNVGFGITTPSAKLDVNGNVQVPGASNYRYSTAKTKHMKVGAAEMLSANSALYSARIDDGFSSGTINGLNSLWAVGGAGGNPAYFIAPVHLADSAIITGLSALVVKNGGSLQSTVELWRTDGMGYLTSSAQLIATCATSFSGGGMQNISAGSVNATYRVVDNSTYFYFIRYTGEQNAQNLRFTMADVTYQIYRSEH